MDISLTYVHISGKENKVDYTLSRWVGSNSEI